MLVTLKDLQYLAECFGLPCIIQGSEITIIGEKRLLVFKRQENNQCQLTSQAQKEQFNS